MPLYHVEDEKDRHVAAIIHMLNEVDGHVKQLKDLGTSKNRHPNFVMQDAMTVFEKCFYKCQVVEEQIKQGYTRGFLTRKNVDTLNQQLNNTVQSIINQSRQSEILLQVLREKFGVDVTG